MSSNTRRSWGAGDENGATSTDHVGRHRNRQQLVPRSLHYRLEEDAGGMTAPWRLFEERVRTGPYRITRFPWQPYSPVRVLILESGTEERVNPRLRQFINDSPPRIRGDWSLGSALPQPPEEHGLTDAEFRKAMNKLKKQAYAPPPSYAKKRGLFGTRSRSSSSSQERDDGKQCTICLENLVRNEQVMVTPCNHTFHNDCLVPWVKGHGNCPVCRFVLCERRESALSPLNNSNYNYNNDNNNSNGVLSEEVQVAVDLVALLRAMEEAFNWVHVST
ncbi:uncharacterized protein M6B38_317785 [Iris pallida]|uniref:RING-type E3 ubiquitin transferase n=1 Tax=Iris pallida TaxID=29817 RepID=A0AAX6HDA4_IRIPA|nr:uncharacterized protein M6B38_317785 [Iris pallida]